MRICHRDLGASPKAAKTLALVAGFLFLAMFGGAGAIRALAQVPESKPAGYVSDFAGVLTPQGKQQLEALATELDRKTGSQLAIVAVNSLGGEPIEDFSVDLATRWGIGRKDKGDTGVLLLLAIQDRQNRMEVGYGIEPIIPDGRAGSILRDMRPLLQAGNYDGALLQAAGQIAALIAKANNVTLSVPVPRPGTRQPPEHGGSPLAAPFWLLILLLLGLPILMAPRRRRSGWHGPSTATGFILGGLLGSILGGGRGGGGGGFSSGGFGGFGGGGFGGGGASSSW